MTGGYYNGKSKNNKWNIEQKCFQCFYNNVRFQYRESECGTYAIYFITEFLKGQKFQDIIHKNITDQQENMKHLLKKNFHHIANYYFFLKFRFSKSI